MTGLSSSFHLLFTEQRYIVGMKSILKTNAMNALWSAQLLLGGGDVENGWMMEARTNEQQQRQAKKIHVAFWVVGILSSLLNCCLLFKSKFLSIFLDT